jgi:hypothetical protein
LGKKISNESTTSSFQRGGNHKFFVLWLISGFAALLIQSKSKSYEMSIGEKVVLAVAFLYSYLLVLWGYSTPTTDLLTAWGFGILGILGFVKLTRGQFLELKSSSLPVMVFFWCVWHSCAL